MMNARTLHSLALLASGASIAPAAVAQSPNIILFMVDDMGWQDTSVPFWTERTPYNDTYETPAMERLAQQGMMFTQAYACSISSPSRCSLITGMNNARHRVTNWTLEKDVSTDLESPSIQLPDWNLNGICLEPGVPGTYAATSFVETLRRHGYHTIHCGKAHFGAIGTPGADPRHFGFEVNIAGHAAGGLATYLSENNFGHTPDGRATSLMSIPGLEEYWGTGVFATEALTREAIKALDEAKDTGKPFFLYMAHYAVHIPIDRDMRFYPKYKERGLTDKEAAYASLIEGMDKSLGDLMAWLEASGEADNTIVIFMSDNGGLATAPYWRDGEPFTQNAPLTCGKGSLYEGGIRVPMIVRWPGTVPEGSACHKYLMIEDFYPSILEMAGVSPDDMPDDLDGISFVPLLRGTGDPSRGRAIVWNYPNIWGNDGPGINLNCAIRRGPWKLIYHYDTGQKELYRITTDIGEHHDLIDRHPAIARRLARQLGNYLRAAGADRPSFKDTGLPCPWPDDDQLIIDN